MSTPLLLTSSHHFLLLFLWKAPSVTIHIMNKYGWCCITSIYICFLSLHWQALPVPLLVYLCQHTSLIWCTLAEDMPFACGIHMTRWWQHILSTVHAGCTFCLFLLDWLLLFSSLLSHMKATTAYMASEFSFLSYLPGGKQSYFSPSLSSSVHNHHHHHHHHRKFSWLQYSRPTDGGSKLTGYNW